MSELKIKIRKRQRVPGISVFQGLGLKRGYEKIKFENGYFIKTGYF